MSFDGLFTKAMVEELQSTLKGGRINKVHQPYKNEMILVIRANGKNHKLLLSAHPSYARVQLTNETYDNPSIPPMFCMLLRKHLEGYILEDIKQMDLDRIIILEIKGRNEIGDVSYKKLIIEIMGRHSNITLIDQERNMILDCIKHVSFAVNRHRALLPGQTYMAPPAQNKANPLEADETDVLRRLDFNSGKLDKQLVEHYSGFSPLFAKEIVYQAGLANRATLPSAFIMAMDKVRSNKVKPTITTSDQKETFYFLQLDHIKGEHRHFESLSQMLDRYYFGKAERDRVKQQGNDLEKFISNEKEKNTKKIEKLKQTMQDAKNAEQFQLYGELITAHMYAIQRGMDEIEVSNYYDENGSNVLIPLDTQKTPSQNAQLYFKKYQKAKHAKQVVQEQIDQAYEEVNYFDHLLQQIQTASPKDIEEIREELVEGGYLRERQRKQKKPGNTKPILDYFVASDGTEMIVGKNNKQNDYLTNKLAAKDDIWLHTKDIPGSHVVIRDKAPSNEVIQEAACLAAYFSKARNSSSVPVDFTKVRNVKKPSGAKPGFVIYDQQQTIFVTPDEEKVISLSKKK
ncbi:NFACT family protein [Cytobacillus sp. Sa5YUA1]|uniref:Rqc2 homolog RqcH n=1 Tax=Cytobacillus stercorigallinarum TaxID=2762240 RepID=A0ABR8QMN4_9BACI|nr:NFACT RNA binding domain-containing protein [Cytobacillus stercorigallinarum]MBD7936782.1 NFACT family protein [Cytobacillus stercorigallinarum]